MTVTDINDYLQVGSHLVTVVGLPLAIALFYREKRKEADDREYETYHSLDDKYIQFLEICMTRPDLDIFDVPLPDRDEPTPVQKREEQIAFTILISMMERAFLMYRDLPS